MSAQLLQPLPSTSRKKPLIRRVAPDRSQRTRHVVQGLFLLLNGWLGLQFYFWARYFERGGTGLLVRGPRGSRAGFP